MKRCFIFLLGFTIFSCQKSGVNQGDNVLKDSTVIVPKFVKEDTILEQEVAPVDVGLLKPKVLKEPKVTPLPFGCELLVTHKFPKEWEANSVDDILLPNEKEFNDIGECASIINSAPSVLAPVVNKIEYIKVGKYDSLFLDRGLLYLIDSCKYRLPDFEMYECYYFHSINTKGWNNSYSPYCLAVGNLLLIDKTTRNAKIINLSTSLVYHEGSRGRDFYISKEKEINVFEYYVDGQVQTFTSLTNILVSENGELVIKVNTINNHIY